MNTSSLINRYSMCGGRRNQEGFVLVTALLILVVLSIMGTASMMLRNTEQKITSNVEVFQHNFYVLETTALEGITTLEGLSDTVLTNAPSFPSWLKQESPSIDLRQSSQWPSGAILPANTSLTTPPVNITPPGYASNGTASGDRIWYAAVDKGPCPFADLSDPDKIEECYDVYSMYDVKSGPGKAYHGKAMLLIGYKKVLYF